MMRTIFEKYVLNTVVILIFMACTDGVCALLYETDQVKCWQFALVFCVLVALCNILLDIIKMLRNKPVDLTPPYQKYKELTQPLALRAKELNKDFMELRKSFRTLYSYCEHSIKINEILSLGLSVVSREILPQNCLFFRWIDEYSTDAYTDEYHVGNLSAELSADKDYVLNWLKHLVSVGENGDIEFPEDIKKVISLLPERYSAVRKGFEELYLDYKKAIRKVYR